MYNLSKFFKNSSDAIFEEFINNYTSHVEHNKPELSNIYNHYKTILILLEEDFEEDIFIKQFEIIAQENAMHQTPYIMLINEVYNLQSILINKMVNDTSNANIIKLMDLFKKATNKVAHIFLLEYITRILSQNNVRITSLSDLIDKNIIIHYEAHLIWINNLAQCVKTKEKSSFPELDAKLCEFGQWLRGDAKEIIQNNSKYKAIDLLHNNLHLFGTKIYESIGTDEHNITMTYLEKCEFLSLSIGTELALLDNIVMNKRITKDELTGALNRQALMNVFESQYELSLATNNHFVLAMCDLDYFKIVNDTYGHIAGDKMLALFVEIAKKNIRNSDVIIRYGGEEFVIILPAMNKDKGFDVLDKIRLEFEASKLKTKTEDIQTTVSIGMMEITPIEYFKKEFINEYIDIVDKKLYQAKNAGKNKVEVF